MRRIQVGIITTYDSVDESVEDAAKRLARELVARGCVIITGGDGGLMRVIAEEVSKLNGVCVGILSVELEELSYSHPLRHPYNTVEIRSGMTYTARSSIVVRSSDSIVMLAGGAGTLNELVMAYNMGIPVVVLEGSGLMADRLKTMFPDGYLDHRRIVKITYAKTPEEAAELAYRKALEGRRFRTEVRG